MPRSSADQLAAYQRRYRELAEQVADIGFIAAGSITHRYTHCATPGCHCHADPPQRHGPYWQRTAKVAGKTVTHRLSETEARLYQEWIGNDRKLRALIQQMRQVAAEATALITKMSSAA
jgi:alkanesulfonate monooxygenase SsuD/methylene tetrahydromethanopterin reductase-like flavin-dependent oxidoreductase (luciferase family)